MSVGVLINCLKCVSLFFIVFLSIVVGNGDVTVKISNPTSSIINHGSGGSTATLQNVGTANLCIGEGNDTITDNGGVCR
jgi:hypothetical protein